jgi:hypothetical protein
VKGHGPRVARCGRVAIPWFHHCDGVVLATTTSGTKTLNLKLKDGPMKTTSTLAALAGILLLAGCDQPTPTPTTTPETPPTSAAEVKQEVKEAVDTTKSYAVDSKDQFTAAMEKKLKEFDESIANLGKKMETLKDDTTAKASMDTLREKQARLGEKFNEVKQAGKDTWLDVKAGFETALNDLQKAYDDVKAKYGGT